MALGRGGDEPRQAYCRPPQAAPSRGVGSSLPTGAAVGVPPGEAGGDSLPTFVKYLSQKVAHDVNILNILRLKGSSLVLGRRNSSPSR
jgi:hypothetical protein